MDVHADAHRDDDSCVPHRPVSSGASAGRQDLVMTSFAEGDRSASYALPSASM
jgi:hypothetical protein